MSKPLESNVLLDFYFILYFKIYFQHLHPGTKKKQHAHLKNVFYENTGFTESAAVTPRLSR